MSAADVRPRRAAFPLLRREWGIVRRSLLACTVLATFGAALAFLAFDAENRYRIVAEPTMLRSVLFPVGLAAGALCGWLSFVQEMRTGTWDGWMLLPASRPRLLAVKLTVGIAGMIAALLVPSALLWLALHAIRDVGGPIIHFHELLFGSAFTLSVIIAVTTFLTTACAASMAREGHVAFVAPLMLPLAALARFFGSDSSFYSWTPAREGLVAVGAWAAMVTLLAVYVRRAGQAPRAIESTLRAVLVLPMAVVALFVVARVGFGVASRALAEPPREDHETSLRDDAPTIGVDGTIVPLRRNRSISTYGMERLERLQPPSERTLRTPVTALGPIQTFLDEDRFVLRAFEKESGREVGCVGIDGLRGDGVCRTFDGQPRATSLGDFYLLFTSSSVHVLHEDGRVEPVARGAVRGAVTISVDEGASAVAVAIDDDVMVVRERTRETEAPAPGTPEEDEDPIVTIEATIVCHDLAKPGQRVDHIVVEPSFVGAYVSSRAPRAFLDAGDVVICRDGMVAQRAAYEEKGPPGGFRFGRGDLVAMAVGPAVDQLHDELRSEAIRMSDAPWFRPVGSFASSAVCSLALALGLWWRRRVVPWWVLPGMLLGPGYALSCLFLLWRRPRWASVVGGS